jgi:SOS response regulatory protein OraA/RecX
VNKELYAYALKLLSRKDYFEAELLAKLTERWPEEDPAPVIAQRLADRDIDDERSLRSFFRWKIGEGYGPYYIREKLRNKNVEVSIASLYQVIEAEELDMDEAMRRVAQKYIRTKMKKKEPAAFMRAAMNYMAYRGFPAGESLNILKSEVSRDESDFSEGC